MIAILGPVALEIAWLQRELKFFNARHSPGVSCVRFFALPHCSRCHFVQGRSYNRPIQTRRNEHSSGRFFFAGINVFSRGQAPMHCLTNLSPKLEHNLCDNLFRICHASNQGFRYFLSFGSVDMTNGDFKLAFLLLSNLRTINQSQLTASVRFAGDVLRFPMVLLVCLTNFQGLLTLLKKFSDAGIVP